MHICQDLKYAPEYEEITTFLIITALSRISVEAIYKILERKWVKSEMKSFSFIIYCET